MSEEAVAQQSAAEPVATAEPPIIDCKGLGKTYTSGKLEVRALKGVDLAVNRNDFVAIMGPSG